jgi:hypothetical protein
MRNNPRTRWVLSLGVCGLSVLGVVVLSGAEAATVRARPHTARHVAARDPGLQLLLSEAVKRFKPALQGLPQGLRKVGLSGRAVL